VAGGACSAQTLERVRAAGADALEVDVTDQASPRPSSRAWAYALDHDNADRLWELSLELIGGRGGG
jgi:hypothetical protein